MIKYLHSRKHSVLWQTILVLSCLLLIPVSAMLYVSLRLGISELFLYTQDKEFQLLTNYTNTIASNLITVDNLSNQFLFDSQLLDVLRATPEQPDYIAIKSVLLNNERHYYSNRCIESIYLFDPIHPYVLSDEMTYKDQFLDQDILTDEQYTTTGLKPLRTINRSTLSSPQKDISLLTYVKQGYNYSAGLPVTIVINLYPERFTSLMETDQKNGSFFLLDSQGQPLYSYHGETIPEQEILSHLRECLSVSPPPDSSIPHTFSFESQKYFICCQAIPDFGLYTVSVQNHTNFSSSNLLQIAGKLTLPFTAILLLSLAAIGMVSYWLYRPLRQLLLNLDGLFHVSSPSNDRNEYYYLSKMITGLYNQNKDLEEKYTLTKTYAQPYSLHEFLAAPEFDKNAFHKVCSDLTLTLEQPYFYLLLFRFKQPIARNIKESYSESIGQLFTDSFCSMTVIDSHNLTILLNTPLYSEDVFLSVRQLAEDFNQQQYTVMIGISLSFTEIQEMPEYYHDASKKLRERPFTVLNQAEIVDLTPQKLSANFIISKPPLDALLIKISSQDREGSLAATLELLNAFSCLPDDHSLYVKYLIFEIESAIYQHVILLGAKYDDSISSTYQLYEEIREIDDIVSLRHHLLSFLEYSLDMMELKNNTQQSDIANQVLQYIHEHYNSNISVIDIADHVHLSPNYLSNLFKAERNETLLESLTKVRMEHAQELLKNPDLLIKDIASMVGYNTIQSFTRYFKKYYHVTPEQWRKNYLK